MVEILHFEKKISANKIAAYLQMKKQDIVKIINHLNMKNNHKLEHKALENPKIRLTKTH